MAATTKTLIRKHGYSWRWSILGIDNSQIASGVARHQRDARRAARDARKKLLELWPNQQN
jgi:hypothetical protein